MDFKFLADLLTHGGPIGILAGLFLGFIYALIKGYLYPPSAVQILKDANADLSKKLDVALEAGRTSADGFKEALNLIERLGVRGTHR